MKLRWIGLAGVLAAGCLALSGCALALIPMFAPGSVTESGDDWVVVHYDATEMSSLALMDQLLDTERAADDALQQAGLGFIDGNEVGDDAYDLYFVGDDREQMWRVLDPVLARAPVRWDRVELRDGLEDPSPTVLKR